MMIDVPTLEELSQIKKIDYKYEWSRTRKDYNDTITELNAIKRIQNKILVKIIITSAIYWGLVIALKVTSPLDVGLGRVILYSQVLSAIFLIKPAIKSVYQLAVECGTYLGYNPYLYISQIEQDLFYRWGLIFLLVAVLLQFYSL